MSDKEWEKLFEEGSDLMEQGRKKEGLEKLRDAARARGMDLGPDLDRDLGLSPSTTPVKSGCFIATAIYGSEFSPEVLTLREMRDRFLAPSSVGMILVTLYYRLSPPLANFLSKHTWMASAVKILIMYPLVALSESLIRRFTQRRP